MQPNDIHNLVELVPPDFQLYAANRSANLDGVTLKKLALERVSRAVMDPAFGWNFVKAFAEQKQQLLGCALPTSFWSAWSLEVNGHLEKHLGQALMLRQPGMKMKRALLEALLIMPDVTLERIASISCLSVKAVKIYSELWFDVRERFDDAAYIAGIVYPETRLVELQPDYFATVDPVQLLLRAAHNTGSVEVLLKLFGATESGQRLSDEELIQLLRLRVLAEADFIIQVGGIHQDLPILNLAMKLVTALASKRVPRPDRGARQPATEELGMGQSILLSCQRRGLQQRW